MPRGRGKFEVLVTVAGGRGWEGKGEWSSKRETQVANCIVAGMCSEKRFTASM